MAWDVGFNVLHRCSVVGFSHISPLMFTYLRWSARAGCFPPRAAGPWLEARPMRCRGQQEHASKQKIMNDMGEKDHHEGGQHLALSAPAMLAHMKCARDGPGHALPFSFHHARGGCCSSTPSSMGGGVALTSIRIHVERELKPDILRFSRMCWSRWLQICVIGKNHRSGALPVQH